MLHAAQMVEDTRWRATDVVRAVCPICGHVPRVQEHKNEQIGGMHRVGRADAGHGHLGWDSTGAGHARGVRHLRRVGTHHERPHQEEQDGKLLHLLECSQRRSTGDCSSVGGPCMCREVLTRADVNTLRSGVLVCSAITPPRARVDQATTHEAADICAQNRTDSQFVYRHGWTRVVPGAVGVVSLLSNSISSMSSRGVG